MENWSGEKMSYQTDLRNKNRGYMKLIVWQRALDLFDMIWRITHVEAQIDFKLRSQLVDAGQSVSANIAEGYGRRSLNEYVQFLYIALGSLAETLTRAIGLQRTEQMTDARFSEFDQLHYEVENRLLRLIEKLEQKKDDGNWMARIAEDPRGVFGRTITPILHYSNTPFRRLSVCESSLSCFPARCAATFTRPSPISFLSFSSWSAAWIFISRFRS